MTSGDALPLEGDVERVDNGWSIQLPVRAEQLRPRKRTVVAEYVHVRREPMTEVVQVAGELQREVLRVERHRPDREG